MVEVYDQVPGLFPFGLLLSHHRLHVSRLGACGGTTAQHPARAAEDNQGNVQEN